jgi:hypothetical protein
MTASAASCHRARHHRECGHENSGGEVPDKWLERTDNWEAPCGSAAHGGRYLSKHRAGQNRPADPHDACQRVDKDPIRDAALVKPSGEL